jgi:hypothetical protein
MLGVLHTWSRTLIYQRSHPSLWWFAVRVSLSALLHSPYSVAAPDVLEHKPFTDPRPGPDPGRCGGGMQRTRSRSIFFFGRTTLPALHPFRPRVLYSPF